MIRLAIAAMLFASFVACTDDGPRRDTAGGGYRAACLTTNDCGCRDQRNADDPFCEVDNSVQLQCLGAGKKCTLTCQTDTDCEALFGATSQCTNEQICNN